MTIAWHTARLQYDRKAEAMAKYLRGRDALMTSEGLLFAQRLKEWLKQRCSDAVVEHASAENLAELFRSEAL